MIYIISISSISLCEVYYDVIFVPSLNELFINFQYRIYRLNSRRELGNLFGIGNGFCAKLHSGIGNISYVKDVLTDTVVTTTFKCSKFGLHISDALGWVRLHF